MCVDNNNYMLKGDLTDACERKKQNRLTLFIQVDY